MTLFMLQNCEIIADTCIFILVHVHVKDHTSIKLDLCLLQPYDLANIHIGYWYFTFTSKTCRVWKTLYVIVRKQLILFL